MWPRYVAPLTGVLVLAGGAVSWADEQADALVAKARQASTATNALEADLVLSYQIGAEKQQVKAKVRLLKPHFGEVQLLDDKGKVFQQVVSDGKDLYVVIEAEKQYFKQPVGEKAQAFTGPMDAVGTAFFAPEKLGATGSLRYVGKETVEGQAYEVVEQSDQAKKTRLYFGKQGLLEGSVTTQGQADEAATNSVWFKNIKLNPKLTAKQFAFTPRKGFTTPEQPDYNKSLLPVGAKAPDFNLPQPGGGNLSLSDALKGKKAVLINFWFYG